MYQNLNARDLQLIAPSPLEWENLRKSREDHVALIHEQHRAARLSESALVLEQARKGWVAYTKRMPELPKGLTLKVILAGTEKTVLSEDYDARLWGLVATKWCIVT